MNNGRLPAEWEPQSLVMLSFPRKGGDYGEFVESAALQHLRLCGEICRKTPVLLVVNPDDITFFEATLVELMANHQDYRSSKAELSDNDFLAVVADRTIAGIFPQPIYIFYLPTNDVWARDFGPVTTVGIDQATVHDFTFNGWGNKYPANLDNRINHKLAALGIFNKAVFASYDFVLEGGSIESDGAGTIMSTRKCLLHPQRNPALKEEEILAKLKELLGASQILLLDHGHLENDDTDAHIDTIVRFAPDNAIVYQACDDPNDRHYKGFQQMAEELSAFNNVNGLPYRLHTLPWPGRVASREDGRRLPASYANFLITNGLVICPSIHKTSDPEAVAVLQTAFPGHEVILVEADYLLEQHGSIHCLTMQLPAIPGCPVVPSI